jgi:hypothetical protein
VALVEMKVEKKFHFFLAGKRQTVTRAEKNKTKKNCPFSLLSFPQVVGGVMEGRIADCRRLHLMAGWRASTEREKKIARIGCFHCGKPHTIYNLCNRSVDLGGRRIKKKDTDYLNCTTPENARYREHIKWMLLWVITRGDPKVNVGCPWIGLPMELFLLIYGFIEHDEITFYLYHLKNNKLGAHNLMRKRIFNIPRLSSVYRFRNELSERVSAISRMDSLIRGGGTQTMYAAPHKLNVYMVKDGIQNEERLPVINKDRESLFRYVEEKYAVRILIVPADDYALYNKDHHWTFFGPEQHLNVKHPSASTFIETTLRIGNQSKKQ